MKTKIYENLADLFPLWREVTLEKKGHEKKEVDFIIDIFKKSSNDIKTIIDLGGGVGLHADLLQRRGYEVTVFDQSEKALSIVQKSNPNIKTIAGSFENINIQENFDAAICMWSTLSYIYTEEGRKNFYNWQSAHIKNLIILDQPNFQYYPEKFHKIYKGENESFVLTVHRDWEMQNNLKRTKFIYELLDKKSNQTERIDDAEDQQYLTIEELKKYLNELFSFEDIYGDYDVANRFDKESPRMIAVFKKQP